MRELHEYSKYIRKSKLEDSKFRAKLAGMKIEVPDEQFDFAPETKARLEELDQMTLRRHGFKN